MALSEVDETEADEDCGAVAEVGDSWPAPAAAPAPPALGWALAAGDVPFEVAVEVAGGGGVRVTVDELFCWPSELFDDLRVLPTSRLNRELKVDDIGSCHVGCDLRWAAAMGSRAEWKRRAQIGWGEHRCDGTT